MPAASGSIIVANGSHWVAHAMTGDVTISSTGVTTVGNVALSAGGTHANLSGTGPGILIQATAGANVTVVQGGSSYSVTNGTTDRTYDANATSVDELADILATLIADLQALKILT